MSIIGVQGGTVISMDNEIGIVEDGGVIIRGTDIVAVDVWDKLTDEFEPDTVVDARGSAIIPGLIDCHVHVSDILFRGGIGSDRELYDWLYNIKLPGVGAMSPEEHRVASALYCTELVQSGATTFVENAVGDGSGYDRETIAAKISTYDAVGIRSVYGDSFVDREPSQEFLQYIEQEMAKEPTVDHVSPVDVVADTSDALENIQQLIEEYHGSNNGRQSIWPAPLFPYTTTPTGLEGVYDIAEEYDVMMTTHVAETEHEVEGYQTPVEYLDTVGALGDRSLLGHCVYLSDRDIRLLKQTGATVSHNPLTNMALGAGHAPVPTMKEYGVSVGLGTDNSSASDTVNVLNDTRFAALVHKGHHCDPSIITAREVLGMATIDAARAIGRESELGSLTPGKKADIAVVDLSYPHLTPSHDPVSTLVYQTQGFEVQTVLCNGEIIMSDRDVVGISADYPDLLKSAQEASETVATRVGLPEA